MRGKDGRLIESEVGAELDYLSQISRRLGVADLVEDYFAPVVGDWNDLHDEAERWRAAGRAAENVTKDLLKPLGRLDSAWQGASADSFVEHMRKVGLAGNDMTDAMTAMGDALDETAEGLRGIVQDMSHVFRDTADVVSGAAGLPLDGDARIIGHLDELREPAKEMYESVRDVLEAFLRLCDGLSGEDAEFAGPRMEHRYPEENWAFAAPATTPQAVTAGPGVGAVAAAGGGSMSGTLPTGGGSAGGGSVGGGSAGGGSVGGGSAGGGSAGGGSVGGGSAGGGSVGGGSAGGSVGGGSVGGVGSAPAAAEHGPTQSGGFTAVQEPHPADSGAVRPAAAAAGGGGGAASGGQPMGGAMMGGAPMGGGGQQGGDKEHKSKVRLAGSTEDVLGKPKKSAPPVLGQD
ncbi:WXG100 family type VII secretion target [Umezawaea endophytica]|uniref:WXG100 family type VII secretion target n=1 Tax=Umezawaea endophytica TaxID=1654476 RepID=UPI0023E00254|nr:WXG100 family type VII secretion target [Umezawaea endophytica]